MISIKTSVHSRMTGYKKRSGTVNLGGEYEIKMASLLALRCALNKNVREMRLGINIDEVGVFDDIFLFKEDVDGSTTAYLLQLKHQNSPENIKRREFRSKAKKDDFTIEKYHKDYCDLKERLKTPVEDESSILEELRNVDKLIFILYTNRGVNVCDFLESVNDDSLTFLDTGNKKTMYKYKGGVDDQEFSNEFFLLSNQTHLSEIEKLIIEEIANVLKTNLPNKIVLDAFFKTFKLWAEDGEYCQPLTKTDVLNQTVDLLLDYYKINLSREWYKDYEFSNETMLIWNEMVLEKTLTLVESSTEAVEFLKTYVGSKLKSYYNETVQVVKNADCNTKAVEAKDNLRLLDIYKNLWFLNKVPLLLYLETEEEYKHISSILKLSNNAKSVIAVTKKDFTSVAEPNRSDCFLSLTDVKQEHINKILKIPIKLQGRQGNPLSYYIDESMYHLLKPQDIISILSGSYMIGDPYQDLPDFFIERYLSSGLRNNKINVNEINSNITILSGEPGMGKSVFLDYLSHYASSEKWVVRLNLADFDKTQINTYVECSSSNELAAKVFQKIKFKQGIMFLLDAFDEVPDSQQEDVIKFAKTVSEQNFTTWITTRPFLKRKLEAAFTTTAVNLWPFTQDDQKNFLIRYFSAYAPKDQTLLQDFVDELLLAAQNNLSRSDDQFTGIPLQTMMLANVFRDNYQQSLELGVVRFNKSFDLLSLYEQFIEMKLNIMRKKFGSSSINTRPLYEKQQKLYAVLEVFHPKDLNLDVVKTEIVRYNYLNMQLMQQEGLVTIDIRGMKFVHCTFAECLAAQWFSENPNKGLNQIEFRDRYKFFFVLYNYILTKNNALHRAIVDLNLTEALNLIKTKPDLATEVDACGRNVVHLVALYDTEFRESNQYQESMLDVLRNICDVKKLAKQRDKSLCTPLDYAVSTYSLAIGNYLAQYHSTINLKFKDFRIVNCISMCASKRYSKLQHLLLRYFFAYKVLSKPMYTNLTGTDFFCLYDIISPYIKPLISENYKQPLKELFKFKNTDVDDYYCDLRFATSFGGKNNIEFLLKKGIDVNEIDVNDNTSLHYACIWNRLDNAMVLLQHGANVNLLNEESYNWLLLCAARPQYNDIAYLLPLTKRHLYDQTQKSALNIAIENGSKTLVLALLKKNADVNKIDQQGNSSLITAIKLRRFDVAMILLDCGAKVNLKNNAGKTALNVAAEYGSEELVSALISAKIDINNTDLDGNSALLTALKHRRSDLAMILLQNGAIVNLRNNERKTAINIAVENGLKDVVLELIEVGIDVNNTDCYGNSPLITALICKHFDLAMVLLDNGVNPNLINAGYNNALNISAKIGLKKLVLKLMAFKVDVDSTDLHGSSPLILALKHKHIDVAMILLDNNANFNLKNSQGQNALNIAAKIGLKELVLKLIAVKVDINNTDYFGNSPLITALQYEHTDVAMILIENGANIHLRNYFGCDALSEAVSCGLNELVSKLISKGADVNNIDKNGHSPLIRAILNKHFNSAMILLQKDVNINVRNMEGETALSVAIELGPKELVLELLSRGADVNNIDNNGNTPLIMAIIKKHFDLVVMLLENDANVNLGNYKMKTALNVAVENGLEKLVAELLSRGADVNNMFMFRDSPLIRAVVKNYFNMAMILLQAGADVNFRNDVGTSALSVAAEVGSQKLVAELLSRGADVDNVDMFGNSPLFIAIRGKHFDVVTTLLDNRADVNLRYLEKKTALSVAVENGLKELVLKLISKGADVDNIDLDGNSPLITALIQRHFDLAVILLDNDANVNVRNNDEKTALTVAAEAGSKELVAMLITKQADVNNQDMDGNSPLIISLEHKNCDVATTLLENGADISLRNKEGKTALNVAVECGLKNLVSKLILKGADVNNVDLNENCPLIMAVKYEHFDIVTMLLQNRANVRLKNFVEDTALNIAAGSGSKELVLELLRNQADVNDTNSYGNSPLMMAVIHKHSDIAMIMLKNGADVNLCNNEKKSALNVAAEGGLKELVPELLSKGADVNNTDCDGNSPLMVAIKHMHTDVAKILLTNGANVHLRNRWEMTALNVAAEVGLNDMVLSLTSANVDVDNIDLFGNSPLITALQHRHTNVATILLENGAYVNLRNLEKKTALTVAAEGGLEELVLKLLSKGANVS